MSYDEIERSYYSFLKKSEIEVKRGAADPDTKFPYIVYTVTGSDFHSEQPFLFNIYSIKEARLELTEIVEKIESLLPAYEIGENGYTLFEKGDPFVQDFDQEVNGTLIKGVQVGLIVSQVYV